MALKLLQKNKTRTREPKSDYKKLLTKIRAKLSTSIVEIELVSDKSNLQISTTKNNKHISSDLGLKYVLEVSEHMRLIRNTTVGVLFKNYTQLIRTKEYRGLLKEYNNLNKTIVKLETKIKNKPDISGIDKASLAKFKIAKGNIGEKLESMKVNYNVTEAYARNYAKTLRQFKFTKPDAILALKCADRAWACMYRIMFGDAKTPNYLKFGEYPSIEAKQAERCIILKHEDISNEFYIKFGGFKFNLAVKKNDLFVQETLDKVLKYMKNSEDIESFNIDNFNNGKELKSTYRVKYNRIVLRNIRGRIRIYLQICLEGEPLPKRDKEGNFKHKLGIGIVATDVGTQSQSIVSKKLIILKNLAERMPRTIKYERDIKLLNRKLTRSRIKNNPAFYNENGTNKKRNEIPETVHWKTSKNYIKLRTKYSNMNRSAASSRTYAINEDVNIIRSLGDTLLTETMNFKALQKRAQETTINKKTGKFNRKKRFGKSISVRNPGQFLAQLKYKFELTGGKYTEVNTWTFKASQYDHVLDACNKKQLSKRWHVLPDGTKLQRDIYSAYLMYCSNDTYDKPNKGKCDKLFFEFLKLHNICVTDIMLNKTKVMNSGITFN